MSALTLACAVDDTPERLGFTEDTLTATPNVAARRPIDFVGRWRGSAPDLLELSFDADGQPLPFRFPSGSSDFTVDIQIGDATRLDAELTFGAPAPLDPHRPPRSTRP